ncbi:MAG: 23S rRNA (adenine(2503)-C(2))-methyltransferase RlmN [Cryomorphaceae bacterium]|nr:MAG: 23S rRNA (adenine(2503)-C(2))-methyltransferase RlmN [Cryomorphaceae bacterium]|tara:strand:- start:120 stop:1157 length:1038 start_codon:yes stop_codon:yes gene_type:complete
MHISSDIRSLDLKNLEKILIKQKFKKYRAIQINDWLIKEGVSSFHEMKNLPKDLILFLDSRFKINNVNIKLIKKSRDGTAKFLISLSDKNIIEAVLIPTEKRITACISSQVGCSLDCDFCATSKISRIRNLNFYEIFDQTMILNAESSKLFGRTISNIVFMGMGEPLLNYKNVLKAIEMICSKKGLGISKKKITVSTSGISKIIKILADQNVKFNLAVSLHSAIEKTRNDIMPFSKDFPLNELLDSLNYWYKKTKSKITIEYLVWQAINDNMHHINSLVDFCVKVPSKVNLIEFNEIGNLKFKTPQNMWIQKYIEILKANNISVSIRRSRGKDINAACGQLANKI